MNEPLITMTHVCRSWRNLLLSTPSLWTQIDFSASTKSQQAEGFLCRSGNQPLNIHQILENPDDVEPFLSTTLHNVFRLQGLSITSFLPYFGRLLRNFSASAPELKYLDIANEPNVTEMDIKLPKVFGGRMPKLTRLELRSLRTNLRNFNPPPPYTVHFYDGNKNFRSGSDILLRKMPFARINPNFPLLRTSTTHPSSP